MEVCGFVDPSVYPAFADSAEVTDFARTVSGMRVCAFAHEISGAKEAFKRQVDVLVFPVSACSGYRGPSLAMSPEILKQQLDFVRAERDAISPSTELEVVVVSAFSIDRSPSDHFAHVINITRSLHDVGINGISLADSFGVASPAQVRQLFKSVLYTTPESVSVGAHFHASSVDHLDNVVAAIESGVTRFDASLAGMGGNPVHQGKGGNVAIEDLVNLFNRMGIATGVDLSVLEELSSYVRGRPKAAPLFDRTARRATNGAL